MLMITPVKEQGNVVGNNFPNPFSNSTKIEYILKDSAYVECVVYNVAGQEIKCIETDLQGPGKYGFNINLSGENSGIYFYQFNFVSNRGEEKSDVKRMMLLKNSGSKKW